jgi:hypothetical protein
MASAHGAGLMLVPIMLGWTQGDHAEHSAHTSHMIYGSNEHMVAVSGPLLLLLAVVVHSAGHLLVSVAIALVVYEKLGLALLRRAWFNLDLIWMIALMVSGVLILLL